MSKVWNINNEPETLRSSFLCALWQSWPTSCRHPRACSEGGGTLPLSSHTIIPSLDFSEQPLQMSLKPTEKQWEVSHAVCGAGHGSAHSCRWRLCGSEDLLLWRFLTPCPLFTLYQCLAVVCLSRMRKRSCFKDLEDNGSQSPLYTFYSNNHNIKHWHVL